MHGRTSCQGLHRGDESKINWLRERMLTSEKKISMIRKTAGKYPQESYAAVVRAIQSEWIFLLQVTRDMGCEFVGVDKMIQDTFLPHLFFIKTKTLSLIVGDLSTMPINTSVMVLLNPVTPEKDKYLRSQRGNAELIRAVTGEGIILQCQPPTDAQGRKARQAERPGSRE